MFKRAKGRAMAYAKLNGHDTIMPVVSLKKVKKWFRVEHDIALLVPHNKGLGRPRIAYARMVARARNDSFYDGVRVLTGS